MATKKSAGTKSARKYSQQASREVETEMREMKEGKLTIGRSGKKVTNPKQAIAIGLAEARRKGAKTPPPPATAVSGRKTSGKTFAKKSSSAVKTPVKKASPGKKSATKKKSAARKSAVKKSRKS